MNPNDEFLFKILTALLSAVYAGIHRYFLKGQREIEKILVVHERCIKFSYALLILAWIPLLLYFLTPWIDSFHFQLPPWLRWCGCGILILGDTGFWWTHKALGKNWAPVLEIHKGQDLVTRGPYSFVRHPMYAAMFFIHMGMALLSANWIVAMACLGSMTAMYFLRVSEEEKMMVEYFGEAYRDYMNRTGRMFPRLHKPRVRR